MANATLRFEPDYAVAPGATLKEVLDEKGVSQAALAVRTGMTEKNISQIINGVAPISYETAEKFEMALGVPAHFWNQRESAYRETLARIAATERMKGDVAWLDEIPVDVLKSRAYIDSDADNENLVRSSLKFFGVSSVESWRITWGNPVAQFRGGEANDRKPGFVAAWLRIGDVQAAGIDTAPFNPEEFRRALVDARAATTRNSGLSELQSRCADAGVAVVFTREIPSASVSGATRWITKDKALIQLSLKFKTTDQVWFTFFHEAGHILLHGKKQTFLEFGVGGESDEEREADVFARDLLIPPAEAKRLPLLRTASQITAYANSIGISPGIVVGRLQRDRLLTYKTNLNGLKPKVNWK